MSHANSPIIRTPSYSRTTMTELVLPNHANVQGNILGGRVMHLMDMCAAMSAYKHARSAVVTASVDQLDFLAPAKMGDIMILKSSVNFTGSSSMEVGVRIESENPKTGNTCHTVSAYLTFVSLNENGKPQKILDVKPETEIEHARFSAGRERYNQRRERIKRSKNN